MVGVDLLGEIDQCRVSTTVQRFPRVPDNDGDLLSNAYELVYGLDPDSPKDASLDLDGDGSSNLEENIAGTDPSNAEDFFRITDVQLSGDIVTINWPSVAGKGYRVDWSTDLDSWNPGSAYSGNGGVLEAPFDRSTITPIDAPCLFLRVSITSS